MSGDARSSDPPPKRGGETPSPGGNQETEETDLRALFLDVTGTEEVVEERESAVESRYLEDSTRPISEYVTDVARNDGLSDTVDDVGEGGEGRQ